MRNTIRLFAGAMIITILCLAPVYAYSLVIEVSSQTEKSVDLANPFYSTLIGTSEYDEINAVDVDSSGNIYITGETHSGDFPLVNPIRDTYTGSGGDCFITKFSPEGVILYSTLIGGDSRDSSSSIHIDGDGYIYIAGWTESPDFPLFDGYDSTLNGNIDCFVMKLNPNGSSIVYSTAVGGSEFESPSGMSVDSMGCVYLTGKTNSADFPLVNALFSEFNAGSQYTHDDLFICKLSDDGKDLLYSTYYGSSSIDYPGAIDVDNDGNAYVTGTISSALAPVTDLLYQGEETGGYDFIILKLNSTGNGILFSTRVGGSGHDFAYDLDLLSDGAVCVTGTSGPGFVPGSGGSHQPPPEKKNYSDFPLLVENDFNSEWTDDAVVFKLDSTGHLLFSTLFGGSGEDYPKQIDVSDGNIRILGFSREGSVPTTSGAFDKIYSGTFECFICEIDAAGVQLMYSSQIGGNGREFANALAIDNNGLLYIGGRTDSIDYITSPSAISRNLNGNYDGFLMRITNLSDDDSDEIADEWELAFGLDPSDPSDATTDLDGDGIINRDEYRFWTNPLVVDSDQIGFLPDTIIWEYLLIASAVISASVIVVLLLLRKGFQSNRSMPSL